MKFKNLVVSGGGIKGALTLGAIKELEKDNWLDDIENVLGTSIGSFIGLLHIIGYTGDEMNKVFCDVNMNEYRKISIKNLMNNFGLDNGDDMMKLWKAIIKYKTGDGNITFQQIYDKYQKSIIISAVQLNPTKTVYFTKENEPDMSVIEAIRLSISVPIYYTPKKWKGKYYLDGSTIDHFHSGYFPEDEKTLYLLIYSKYVKNDKDIDEINTFQSYLKFMFYSIFDYIQEGQFEDIVCNPAVMNIEYNYTHLEFLDSKIETSDVQNMINEGQNRTREYIDRIKTVDNNYSVNKKSIMKNMFYSWKEIYMIKNKY